MTESKLISHKILHNYGVNLSEARYTVLNHWKIHNYAPDYLWEYYVLRYTPEMFLTKLCRDGTLTIRGRKLMVVYNNCSYYDVKHARSVLLSVRIWQSELEQVDTVLVRASKQPAINLEEMIHEAD